METPDIHKIHRSTSIRLRKRRDQAKKDFLQNRRSGQFVSDTQQDGWSYVSFPSPPSGEQTNKSGPVSVCAGQARGKLCPDESNHMAGGPRSLGYLPRHHHPPGPSLVSDQTIMQVMSDTEDCVRTRGRGGRGTEESKERKLWRKSAIGMEEQQRENGFVYKDFGLIDSPQQLEALSEINFPSLKQDRVQRNLPCVARQTRADWGNNYGHVVKLSGDDEPFSLPVTVREHERQIEHVPLLKGMLWQKKDRIFSKWKERYFLLTPACLHCYEKCPTNTPDLSSVRFKVQLSSIACMDLTEKKGYLTIALAVHKEGKILLRSTLGIREWFHVIRRCCQTTQEQSTEEFYSGRQQRESDDIERWLLSRPGFGTRPVHHTSTPTISPHDQSLPTTHQTLPDQTLSQHTIWSHQDTRQQGYTRQKKRSNSQRLARRPKSLIECSTPWQVQNKPSKTKARGINNKNLNVDHKSEDSGNSSLSTSTGDSRRRDRGSQSFK